MAGYVIFGLRGRLNARTRLRSPGAGVVGVPPRVTDLAASYNINDTVTLTWSNPVGVTALYANVFRTYDPHTVFEQLTTDGEVTGTTYTDTQPKQVGQEHVYYYVKITQTSGAKTRASNIVDVSLPVGNATNKQMLYNFLNASNMQLELLPAPDTSIAYADEIQLLNILSVTIAAQPTPDILHVFALSGSGIQEMMPMPSDTLSMHDKMMLLGI